MDSIKKTFGLDLLRGLAALYVLVGHARWLLWEGYSEGFLLHSEEYSIINTFLVYIFSMFSFGHQAVMLFFVLSGFVIHYSTYNSAIQTQSFSIIHYLYKRIKRIYPPYLLAILITCIADLAGMRNGYTIYSGTTQFPLMNENIHADHSWNTLWGNLSMLQTLEVPVWGSNGPLWSLMYEWWFYILYIPVFFINRKQPVLTAYLIGLIFIVSLIDPFGIHKWNTIINYFFAWYLGVIAADIYMGRIQGIPTQIGLGVYIGLVLTAGANIIGLTAMNDYFIAVIFVCFIYACLKYYMQLRYLAFLQPLSDFSYTLYVIHMPILVVLSGWLQQRYKGGLPMHFGYVLSGIVICVLAAWSMHFLVERPFVRKKS